MEKVNCLADEEIIEGLRRMGIRQKPELDIAVAEYKKYWWAVYIALPEGSNNDSSLKAFLS